jgi:hypothetical protein
MPILAGQPMILQRTRDGIFNSLGGGRTFPAFLLVLGLILAGFAMWHYVSRITTDDAIQDSNGYSPDCGPASLYMICKLQGMPHTFRQLKSLSNTNDMGTNLADLRDAAVSIGFSAEGCALGYPALTEFLSFPKHYAILHCFPNHFVAAASQPGTHALYILDSASGLQPLDDNTLSALRWDGVALLLGQ